MSRFHPWLTHGRKETSEVKFKCCPYATHNGWERCPNNGPSAEQPTKPPGQARRALSPLQITVTLSVSGSPFFPPCIEDENLSASTTTFSFRTELLPALLLFSTEPRLSISLDRHFYGSVNDLTVSLAAVRLCPQRSELTKQSSRLFAVAEVVAYPRRYCLLAFITPRRTPGTTTNGA